MEQFVPSPARQPLHTMHLSQVNPAHRIEAEKLASLCLLPGRKHFPALASLALMLICGGCGLSAGSSDTRLQNPTVSITPQGASVSLAQSVQFAATVSGASSTAVNWSVDNMAGGNPTVGTISASGLYSAPVIMPQSATITVTATTQSAPQASASATVQLQDGIAVSIAPVSANLPPGGSVNFMASVTGASGLNAGVSWSVNGVSGGNASLGFLTATSASSATYAAPAFPPSVGVSVIATSLADGSKSASASITVSCPAANSVSPSSATVAAGATQTFAASLCVAGGVPVTWSVNGVSGGSAATGLIAANSATTAIYTAPLSVPQPNSVTIQAAAGTQSASAVVTVVNSAAVAISIAPPSAAIAAGQRASFSASVSGTVNTSVTWAVNGIANGNATVGQVCAAGSNPCAAPSGAEDAIEYWAPQTPPQPNAVTLAAASIVNPAIIASAQITIGAAAQPAVTLAPFYAFLAPSQQFHFFASASGLANASLSWSVASAVPGQGCSGAACGSIDDAGNYVAPAAAPSPNAILITATSAANPALAATATVAVTSGPAIEAVLPSSIVAGAQQSFVLAIQGLNFLPTTSSSSSQILVNNSPRATNCPTPNRCTIALQPSDVASAEKISLQIQNPGSPAALSNPVSLVIIPAPAPSIPISLTSAAPVFSSADITVPEASTAGASASPISVDFVGLVSPDGSSCSIGAAPILIARPLTGSTTVNICVQGNLLDPLFTYSFSAPQTGGDIGVSSASMASLFPNLIELKLTISSQTAPGLRTLFITTPNGDVAAASGMLEVQ